MLLVFNVRAGATSANIANSTNYVAGELVYVDYNQDINLYDYMVFNDHKFYLNRRNEDVIYYIETKDVSYDDVNQIMDIAQGRADFDQLIRYIGQNIITAISKNMTNNGPRDLVMTYNGRNILLKYDFNIIAPDAPVDSHSDDNLDGDFDDLDDQQVQPEVQIRLLQFKEVQF